MSHDWKALVVRHARSSGAASDPANAKPDAPGTIAKDKEPIDWKKLAAQFEEIVMATDALYTQHLRPERRKLSL